MKTDIWQQRNLIFAKLWMKHGCPEKMKITVKSTGEVINLVDGQRVTLTPKKQSIESTSYSHENKPLDVGYGVTLTRTCEICGNTYISQRVTSKFCGMACRQRNRRIKQGKMEIAAIKEKIKRVPLSQFNFKKPEL